MNTHVIITKKAGQDIPKDYLQLALKKFPTCYGIVLQDKDGETPILDVATEAKLPSFDDMVKLLDGCKEVQTMLVLGNLDNFNKDDDIQPFVFQQAGEDGSPQNILAFAAEGDFPNYSKDNGHTDEYNLWEDFVFPTLQDKHEAAGDFDTFVRKINSSQFQQAVTNPISHRGSIVMLPLVGDVIAFGRNDLGGEFEWGETTQTLGWGKPSVVEKTTATVANAAGGVKSRLSRLMGGTATPTPLPDGHTQDPKTGTVTVKEKKDDNLISVIVPAKLQGNARNAWIRLMLGLSSTEPMPTGHMSKTFSVHIQKGLEKFALEDVTTRDNVRDLAARVKVFQETGTVVAGSAVPGIRWTPANTAMKEAHEELDKTEVEQVQDPKKTGAPMDYLPELKADDKKGAVDFVTDWATRPDGKHPSALEIQKMESKWPTFSSMMGIKPIDMTRWTIKDVKDLGKKYPDALALAFIEVRRVAMDHGAFDIKEDKTQKQVEVPSSKPETPAAKPAETGGKKSRLERLTGKAA